MMTATISDEWGKGMAELTAESYDSRIGSASMAIPF
jgi:hypothetical protein